MGKRALYWREAWTLQQDLFRAVTAFKRARILLPENDAFLSRKMQIEYDLCLPITLVIGMTQL